MGIKGMEWAVRNWLDKHMKVSFVSNNPVDSYAEIVVDDETRRKLLEFCKENGFTPHPDYITIHIVADK